MIPRFGSIMSADRRLSAAGLGDEDKNESESENGNEFKAKSAHIHARRLKSITV